MATHFTPATMAYLETLAANNNRDWFQEHKHRYEQDVREPALAFIEAVGARLPAIAPHFTADARKMGGSLMRVYRDSRFSKDKTPYKTNIGIQFRHEAGKDVHAPG
ncbi:MAG: TIGR02453 family protein, partial [Zetaproteobacteria bacterium CG23_combo_of_CG06-09_8_20_14_all_54_7]